MTPLVSIVLPTRNGAAFLPRVLAAIRRQRTDFEVEVIAIDSSSSDGTVDILRPCVDRFVSIDAEAFDHGRTRNLAIEQASGDLIVMLSQDAEPVSDEWLAALTAPLRADPRVAGAFARQRLRPDADAIARHYHDRWVTSSATPHAISLAGEGELAALDPTARLLHCAFDNVCSCIRRSVWSRIPFRETPIAEDLAWAREALLAGLRIVYAADAVVVHSHQRSARYEFLRTYFLHRRLYDLFGLRTIPTLSGLMRAIASSTALHLRLVRADDRRPFDTWRAIALGVAWPAGQYLGGLSAARGWDLIAAKRVRCES